ncbi:MAG: GNAT family N-acetyltransferase [Janthinobacterium lividum]
MRIPVYSRDRRPAPVQVADLYRSAGLVRPVDDLPRLTKMLEYANLLVTAWDGELLVGLARTLTDFCYCAYLSDLAVRGEYQRQGIGRRLLALSKEAVGEESMLLLLSVPAALAYYPTAGMTAVDNGFLLKRTR